MKSLIVIFVLMFLAAATLQAQDSTTSRPDTSQWSRPDSTRMTNPDSARATSPDTMRGTNPDTGSASSPNPRRGINDPANPDYNNSADRSANPQYQGENEHNGPLAITTTLGLGPRVGYYKSNNAASGSWYIGAQARLRLISLLGIEGAADYRSGEQFNYTVGNAQATAKVAYVPVSVSGLLFIPLAYNFAPYILGGVAWYYTMIDYTNDPTHTARVTNNTFGYHVGAGVEIPFSEHVAINGDARWIFLNTNFDLGNTATFTPSNSNGYVITGALMFYF